MRAETDVAPNVDPAGTAAAAAAKPERSGDFVQSLERGLAVIRVFGTVGPTLTLSEVAQATGLARSAARRFLLTLAELSYVEIDGRYFRLRPRVMELGNSYLSGLSLTEIAVPHLEKLVSEVMESSESAVLDGESIIYILRVPGPHIMSANINVGGRMPAHATAMGKVLLAGLSDEALENYLRSATFQAYTPRTIVDPTVLASELARVREQGWAIVDEELEHGLRAMAVPVRDRTGETIAAINVTASTIRRTVEALTEELLPPLRETAAQIERDLSVAPPGASYR